MRDELAAIRHLHARFHAHADDEIGIGDDAALVRAGGGKILWTIDEQAENTHFRREWLSWRDVGYRSFVAAASDIAAMGGTATHALTALALPSDFRDEDFLEIAEGQREAAAAVGARIVGGNMARANEMHVTTTVIGTADRPIPRNGAKAGDGVYVIGALGLAALGMRSLEKKSNGTDVEHAIAAWRRPPILFDAARKMSAHASAAIDISDGLARDVLHIAEESRVRVVLERKALLEHAKNNGADLAARALGEDALDFVLHSGEDYALVVTSDREIEGFFRIGSVIAGTGIGLDGDAIEPRAFAHF